MAGAQKRKRIELTPGSATDAMRKDTLQVIVLPRRTVQMLCLWNVLLPNMARKRKTLGECQACWQENRNSFKNVKE